MDKYVRKFWQLWSKHPQCNNHKEVDLERFVADEDFHNFVTKKAKQGI